ncbi:hypothetical protein GGI43DRAFT_432884 [Trichoderma evansii]
MDLSDTLFCGEVDYPYSRENTPKERQDRDLSGVTITRYISRPNVDYPDVSVTEVITYNNVRRGWFFSAPKGRTLVSGIRFPFSLLEEAAGAREPVKIIEWVAYSGRVAEWIARDLGQFGNFHVCRELVERRKR